MSDFSRFLMLALLVMMLVIPACNDDSTSGNDRDDHEDDDGSDDIPDGDWDSFVDGDAVVVDGDTADGDIADGDVIDGDATDGDVADGDATDGDITDGDATDGDVADGDVTDGDEDIDQSMCGVGDDEKNVIEPLIYYGTETPTLFNMSAGQQKALVALAYIDGSSVENFCSAVVISQEVVLSAAHCAEGLWGTSGLGIAIGPDVSRPEATIGIREFHANPQYDGWGEVPAQHDHSVFILTEPVSNVVPDLVPVPINDDLQQSRQIVGHKVQNGGYGTTQNSYHNTKRYWVAEDVIQASNGEIVVNGMGQHGVCFGDSGGPSFYDFGSGLRVVGNVSWGDESCVDVDHFADTATDAEWIRQYLPQHSCDDVGFVGVCEGDTAIWCEGDQLREERCADGLKLCKQNDAGNYRCVADPCLGITFEGTCAEGEIARWCENGQIKQRHCIPCDQTCGWTGSQFGYYCTNEIDTDGDVSDGDVTDGDTDICDEVGYLGCCSGNSAVWCDNGEYNEVDCSENGQRCGWIDDQYGYFCGGRGEDPSGENPYACP